MQYLFATLHLRYWNIMVFLLLSVENMWICTKCHLHLLLDQYPYYNLFFVSVSLMGFKFFLCE